MTSPTDTTTAAPARTLTLQCQFCGTWNRIDAARAADRPKCGKCAKPMLLDRPYKLTEESFARTIAEAQVPVMVDFYADWCAPCKVMAPFVDEIAAAYQGRLLVAKVDTEAAQATTLQFNLRGIPTTIVFKDGKEVVRQTGAVRRPQLEEMVKRAL
jgi:thioredoxin 2